MATSVVESFVSLLEHSTVVQRGSEKMRRPKRKQVSQACMNCRIAHAGCEETRPCSRCVRMGKDASCQDMPRKRRNTIRPRSGQHDKSPEDDSLYQTEINEAASALPLPATLPYSHAFSYAMPTGPSYSPYMTDPIHSSPASTHAPGGGRTKHHRAAATSAGEHSPSNSSPSSNNSNASGSIDPREEIAIHQLGTLQMSLPPRKRKANALMSDPDDHSNNNNNGNNHHNHNHNEHLHTEGGSGHQTSPSSVGGSVTGSTSGNNSNVQVAQNNSSADGSALDRSESSPCNEDEFNADHYHLPPVTLILDPHRYHHYPPLPSVSHPSFVDNGTIYSWNPPPGAIPVRYYAPFSNQYYPVHPGHPGHPGHVISIVPPHMQSPGYSHSPPSLTNHSSHVMPERYHPYPVYDVYPPRYPHHHSSSPLTTEDQDNNNNNSNVNNGSVNTNNSIGHSNGSTETGTRIVVMDDVEDKESVGAGRNIKPELVEGELPSLSNSDNKPLRDDSQRMKLERDAVIV